MANTPQTTIPAYIAWTDTNNELNVQEVGGLALPALQQQSKNSPALAFFKNSLYIAWTGTDSSQTLNVMAYTNGAWQPQVKLGPQNSNAGPALVATGGYLYLIWMGGDSNHTLDMLYSSDGKTWTPAGSNQISLYATGSSSPSLAPAAATGHCQVALAWIAAQNVVTTLSGMELLAGIAQAQNPNGITSSGNPALAFCKKTLYLGWTDTSTPGELQLASSDDGIKWNSIVGPGKTANAGPALAASGDNLLYAFATGQLLYVLTFDGGDWVGAPTAITPQSPPLPSTSPALTVAGS